MANTNPIQKTDPSSDLGPSAEAGVFGYISITLFALSAAIFWYATHAGWGDGPYHYGALLPLFISIICLIAGIIVSLYGMGKYKKSIQCWIGFVLNLSPILFYFTGMIVSGLLRK